MKSKTLRVGAALLFLVVALPLNLRAAATVIVLNNNAAGVGFNDPTPAAPVGGNPGTTIGQQRLIAFQAAANIWGATLTSVPSIIVRAQFIALSCTATSAVLGSAGPVTIWRNFTGAPLSNYWYHAALANKLAGTDLLPQSSDPNNYPEINANFNVNLGQPNCLAGSPFYYGLDANHGTSIDLMAVVLHELGHGLGYSTTTSGTTGNYFSGSPSIFDHFLTDNSNGLRWDQMTPAERIASAINSGNLVWAGANVTSAIPNVLQLGVPELRVVAPANVGGTGTYLVGTASFGPPITAAGVSGDLMPVMPTGSGPGCDPFTGVNALAVNGNIALIDRGVCSFVVKVKNAQNAGAIAVVIADNVPGSPPPGLGGVDPTITIPAVRITQAAGIILKDALRFRSRTRSGVVTTMTLNLLRRPGADAFGRLLMYAPNPFQSGSSVSHADVSAIPNLLMEPSINGDLTHNVSPPFDLTFPLFLDIGW